MSGFCLQISGPETWHTQLHSCICSNRSKLLGQCTASPYFWRKYLLIFGESMSLFLGQCISLFLGQCISLFLRQCIFLFLGQCIYLFFGQCQCVCVWTNNDVGQLKGINQSLKIKMYWGFCIENKSQVLQIYIYNWLNNKILQNQKHPCNIIHKIISIKHGRNMFSWHFFMKVIEYQALHTLYKPRGFELVSYFISEVLYTIVCTTILLPTLWESSIIMQNFWDASLNVLIHSGIQPTLLDTRQEPYLTDTHADGSRLSSWWFQAHLLMVPGSATNGSICFCCSWFKAQLLMVPDSAA